MFGGFCFKIRTLASTRTYQLRIFVEYLWHLLYSYQTNSSRLIDVDRGTDELRETERQTKTDTDTYRDRKTDKMREKGRETEGTDCADIVKNGHSQIKHDSRNHRW